MKEQDVTKKVKKLNSAKSRILPGAFVRNPNYVPKPEDDDENSEKPTSEGKFIIYLGK